MTSLNGKSILRRETRATLRGKSLVVELDAHTMAIRLKGARWRYEVDYESIFALAAKKEAQRKRLEKNLRRSGKGR